MVKTIEDKIEERLFIWFGYVKKTADIRITRKVYETKTIMKRARRWPKKT